MKKLIYSFSFSALYVLSTNVLAYSDPMFAFNANALFGKKNSNVDLSQFAVANFISEGSYDLAVAINGERVGRKLVNFKIVEKNKSAVVCLDPFLLDALDLTRETQERLPKNTECLQVTDISPEASYVVDMSELTLSISIPLVNVVDRPRGYINPKLFDSGVSSAFVQYNYNTYRTEYKQNDASTTQYLSLYGGANYGDWSYRHSGSFSSEGSSLGSYHSSQNEFSTDVLALRARLSLGQFSTRTYHAYSLPIEGLQLVSDAQMLPMSQRSYAPVIEEFAKSNALVTVYQNGSVIYERNVPMGAFKITDLNAISSQGDLTVQITEASGEKRRFIVPIQSNVNLVRAGFANYSVALGKYRLYNKTSNNSVAQATFDYGLINSLTVYGAGQAAQKYNSYLFGAATNTFLGSFSYDIEIAKFDLQRKNYSGKRSQLNYSYTYSDLNLTFTANSSWQDKDYVQISSAMSMLNRQYLTDEELYNFNQVYNLKNQVSTTIYKSFDNYDLGSIYLNAMRMQYWGDSKKYNQINIGYNNRWKKLSYSIGLAKTDSRTYDSRRIYLNLSIPFDFAESSVNWSASMQKESGDTKATSLSTSISGTLGENNQTSYSVNASRYTYDELNTSTNNLSTYFTQRLPQATLTASLGKSTDSNQYGFGATGGIVAHPYGITLTNSISDTYTIVHAKGAAGASLENAWGVKLDRWGNAIYSNATPYQFNSIALDPKNLPANINLKENKQEIIPRQNSATLAEFEVQKTSLLLLTIANANGRFSMGTQVFNQEQKVVGHISQSDEVLITDIELLTPQLKISLESNYCTIDLNLEKIKKVTESSKRFNFLPVECR